MNSKITIIPWLCWYFILTHECFQSWNSYTIKSNSHCWSFSFSKIISYLHYCEELSLLWNNFGEHTIKYLFCLLSVVIDIYIFKCKRCLVEIHLCMNLRMVTIPWFFLVFHPHNFSLIEIHIFWISKWWLFLNSLVIKKINHLLKFILTKHELTLLVFIKFQSFFLLKFIMRYYIICWENFDCLLVLVFQKNSILWNFVV